MIRLNQTATQLLSLITAQNGATCVVSYSDKTATGYDGDTQVTAISSATTTTICSTPAASTIRDVDHISIRNTYAGSHAITLQLSSSATLYPLLTVTLANGDSLEYTHGSGWQVLDADGNLKVTPTNAISASLVTNTPAGDISSITVQDAINELDTEKEAVANKATSFAVSNDTLYPSVQAVKTYADGLVVGLIDDRGSYDASVNTFPAAGGSGTAGAILKGDLWYISVAGTLGGSAVTLGDTIRALADTPGQTASNWSVMEMNLGYTPENAANKDVSGGYVGKTLEKINFWNAARTFMSFFTNSNTAARTYTFPDYDGTVATLAGTEAFTNKTINLTSNTLSTTLAQLNTAVSDAEIARTDAANTFTGDQTVTGAISATNGISSTGDGTSVVKIGSSTYSSWGGGFANLWMKGTNAGLPTRAGVILFDSKSGTGGFNALQSDAGVFSVWAGATNLASSAQVAAFGTTGLSLTGAISATTTIKTGGYTVATLPAGAAGMRAYVTDATTPTWLAALTVGGSVVAPVFHNGTAWLSA